MTPIDPLERPLYFAGKLLTAEDLQRGQAYVIDRLRRLNRYARGWGIVTGLDVSVDGANVTVEPGLAIDCAGNEIVLAAPRVVAIAGIEARAYVVIRFAETPVDPVTTIDGETRYGRAREDAEVVLAATNPNLGHRGMGPGSPGCGEGHGLCIATLARHGRRWRVTRPPGIVRSRR